VFGGKSGLPDGTHSEPLKSATLRGETATDLLLGTGGTADPIPNEHAVKNGGAWYGVFSQSLAASANEPPAASSSHPAGNPT